MILKSEVSLMYQKSINSFLISSGFEKIWPSGDLIRAAVRPFSAAAACPSLRVRSLESLIRFSLEMPRMASL